MSGRYDFGNGGVPAGLSPDEFQLWAMERRKQFAAGTLAATQPKLHAKATDTESGVFTEEPDDTQDPNPTPSEDGRK